MRTFLIIGAILVFIVFVAIFRPVPIVKESSALVHKGIVKSISTVGESDIVFRLENTQQRFYINRAIQNGMNPDSLKDLLIGEEVTIKFPKYWTPLDWNNTVRHLSKLEHDRHVIFNELK